MKFEEMKRIADARTKAEYAEVWCFSQDDGTWNADKTDLSFVNMATKNWEKMMAVVEAVRQLGSDAWDAKLRKALEELEKK